MDDRITVSYTALLLGDHDSCRAVVPAIPGCEATGATVDDAVAALRLVLRETLEGLAQRARDIPTETPDAVAAAMRWYESAGGVATAVTTRTVAVEVDLPPW